MSTRQINWLFKELPTLVAEKVIDKKVADKIRKHYEIKTAKKVNLQLLLIIFGAIGAVLLGGGIMLILAHNWDQFPRLVRLFFGLAPLAVALGLGARIIYMESTNRAWHEVIGILIALFMGAAIAIVGQVYHLPGNLEGFLLIWALGIVPTVYLLRSNYALIIFMVLITARAAYVQDRGGQALDYWLLLLFMVPYIIRCFGSVANLGKHAFVKWVLAVSLTSALGISLEKVLPGLWMVVYAGYFSVLYMLGCLYEKKTDSLWQKPMQIMGMGGAGFLSYLLAMAWPWKDVGFKFMREGARFHASAATMDYVLAGLFLALAVYLFVRLVRHLKIYEIIFAAVPVVVIPAYLFPKAGMFIFGVYLSVLSFSLITDLGGAGKGSLLKNYGYLLLLVFFGHILIETEGRLPLYWAVALHCFFVLLCMETKLFVEKSATFLEGLWKFTGLVGGFVFLYIMTFHHMLWLSSHYLSLIAILPVLAGTAYVAVPFIRQHRTLGWFLAALPLTGIVGALVPASALLLYNLYFLAAGIGIILLGFSRNKLSYSNSGLLLAALLIFTRFFDSDLSFLGRGIVFILLGIVFLGINIYIVKKRKASV